MPEDWAGARKQLCDVLVVSDEKAAKILSRNNWEVAAAINSYLDRPAAFAISGAAVVKNEVPIELSDSEEGQDVSASDGAGGGGDRIQNASLEGLGLSNMGLGPGGGGHGAGRLEDLVKVLQLDAGAQKASMKRKLDSEVDPDERLVVSPVAKRPKIDPTVN